MRLDKADTGGLGNIGGDITEHTSAEGDTKEEEEPCHGDSGHCYPGHWSPLTSLTITRPGLGLVPGHKTGLTTAQYQHYLTSTYQDHHLRVYGIKLIEIK